jgi:3-oxoacyl-[acyl-carrier-protein] synthase II
MITGTGLLTAAGNGPAQVLTAMETGTRFFTHRVGGEHSKSEDMQPWPIATIAWSAIGWPEGERWANNKKYSNFAGHAAVAVARQAVNGNIMEDPSDAIRSGIVIAVGSTNGGELNESIHKIAMLHETDPRPLATLMYDESPDFSYVRGIPSQIGQFVAMATGFRGSNVVVYGESSAGGLSALSFATRMIQSGELDRVMVVGIGPVMPIATIAALESQESIATDASPGSGPFDTARSGILIGQGAVAILIESDAAGSPDRPPLAELVACETMTASRRQDALDAVVDSVLAQRADPPGVWWACGAGSIDSDREECAAVAPHTVGTPVTASKSTIGNAFECSGLIDVALAIESLAQQKVPPIGLLRDPDPALGHDIDFVIGASRSIANVDTAFITALGYGPNTTAGAALLTRSVA